MISLIDSVSPLGTGLVLPRSHSEPAVQHAVIALSALHGDLDRRVAPLAREELSNRLHRFAISQFGRALSKLNERRHSQDPQFRNVVLTCCLLFVTYEWLRGNGETALMHLRQGFAIILEAPNFLIDQSLLSAMTRLQNQSMFFFGPSSFGQRSLRIARITTTASSHSKMHKIIWIESYQTSAMCREQPIGWISRNISPTYIPN